MRRRRPAAGIITRCPRICLHRITRGSTSSSFDAGLLASLKSFLHAGAPAAINTYRDIAHRCYCFGVVFKFGVAFLCLIREMECRVLSIQSHVVRGYVGNKSASFPLQVRLDSPAIYLLYRLITRSVLRADSNTPANGRV